MKTPGKTYVLDTSVVVKWFVAEEDSDKADTFMLGFQKGEINVLVPTLLEYEVANVLWVKRREGISKEEAVEIMKDLEELNLPTKTAFELMEQAQKFSYKYDVTIYDAMFLALAYQHSCEFITADKKLYNKVKGKLPWVKML
ncbi:MAG: type II toxin-antitoxin system VapC family toxin [Candidatus Poribacteria bacterium]